MAMATCTFRHSILLYSVDPSSVVTCTSYYNYVAQLLYAQCWCPGDLGAG